MQGNTFKEREIKGENRTIVHKQEKGIVFYWKEGGFKGKGSLGEGF